MRPRFSLRLKWTAIGLALALAPLGAAGIAVLEIQRDALASAERDLELATVDAASREIGRTLGDVEADVRRAAKALSDARLDEEARLSLARDAIAEAEAIDAVSVFDKDGAPIGAIEKGGARAPAHVDASVFADRRPRWVGTRFVEPLVVDGAVTGWLVADLRPEAFRGLVLELSTARFGRPDRVFVVDRTLHVVSGDTGALASGSDVSGLELFRRVQLGAGAFARRVDAHAAFAAQDGTPMTGTVRVLPDQEWAVVVVRPEAEAFAALAAARRALFGIAAAIALGAVAVGALVARRITRPVERLADLARAYGRREFDKKSDVTSNDELGELGVALGTMADDLQKGEREIQRRAAVESALSRYMPSEVAAAIAEKGGTMALEGRRADVTILFADVAAFTPFVERAPPERVVALLDELFTVLSEVVFRHHGMVDKFIGDCIMAVFGAGEVTDEHAARALAAAEDMHRFVEASAARWKEEYGADVSLGIGVASGEALVGNIGSERRVEFTAIGDAVNVAARLEALARPGQTLVTASVATRVGTRFDLRSLGDHAVRGKSERVEILEVAS